MSRPEYPNCVMTPEIISRIRENQEHYDSNPDDYERREREQAEQYAQEQHRQNEEYHAQLYQENAGE